MTPATSIRRKTRRNKKRGRTEKQAPKNVRYRRKTHLTVQRSGLIELEVRGYRANPDKLGPINQSLSSSFSENRLRPGRLSCSSITTALHSGRPLISLSPTKYRNLISLGTDIRNTMHGGPLAMDFVRCCRPLVYGRILVANIFVMHSSLYSPVRHRLAQLSNCPPLFSWSYPTYT